jgi:RnfABCDGE-type electron transport complex G subunit
MKMSETLRMVIVLTSISIISGASLAVVDSVTKTRVNLNKQSALNKGLKILMPEAGIFKKEDINNNGKIIAVYRAIKGDTLVGWGFHLKGPGFSDKIEIIAAVNPKITRLLGIEVLEQKETPGLGDNMKKESFRKQFKGLFVNKKIEFVKNRIPEKGSNKIQAMAAATYSTRYLLDIINDNIKKIRHMKKIRHIIGGEK